MRHVVHFKEAESPWKRRVANGLGVAFDIGIRRLYPVEIRGLEHYSRTPSTLVVSNHRRDSDGPVIASVLFQRRNLRSQGVRPCFVAREDLFYRGFLSEYLETWPLPLRAALSMLNLRSLLTLMDAFPMRRIPERTLREVLQEVRDLFGNVPINEVLKPSWVNRFESMSDKFKRPLCVNDILTWRYRKLLYHRHGLSKLSLARFREISPYERSVIDLQLECFTCLLDRGATLLLEPEGVVSVDGRFARFRAALHTLLNRPKTSPRVLPVGITYDSMSNGRERIFVNIGPEMTDLRGLSRRETNERVSTAIRAQLTVTCSQIASQFLFLVGRLGDALVTNAALDTYVAREADRYARFGFNVDSRLLEPSQRKKRLEGYITSCLRRGILSLHSDDGYRLVNAREDTGIGATEPDAIIRYMNNELSMPALYSLPSGISARMFQ